MHMAVVNAHDEHGERYILSKSVMARWVKTEGFVGCFVYQPTLCTLESLHIKHEFGWLRLVEEERYQRITLFVSRAVYLPLGSLSYL